MMQIHLKPAAPHHMPKIRQISKQWTDAIGYIPDEGLRHYIGLGSVVVAESSTDLLGFLVGTFSQRTAPALARVYQIAVDRAFQRCHAGTMMLRAFERESIKRHAKAMMAHVAEDLPSLKWWLSQEYDAYGTAPGGLRRDRRIICLVREFIADAFDDPQARPPRHRPGGTFEAQQPLHMLDSEGLTL